MRYLTLILTFIFLVSFFPSSISGQTSLAEVKKKEEERRKKTEESKKSLDASNIKEAGQSGDSTGFMQSEGSVKQSSASNRKVHSNITPKSPSPNPPGNENVWRRKAQALRRKIEDLKKKVAQDEDILDKAKRAPVVRYRIGDQQSSISYWQNKLRADKENLAKAQREYQEFQQEARRAGIPPGWLRD